MNIGSRLRAPLLAALGAFGTLAGACAEPDSHESENSSREGTGRLGLSLELAPDVQLDTIDYQIVGTGFVLEGSLKVPGTGTTFSATLANIPVGVGHQLRLTSRARGDAGIACAGNATFNVTERATTQVNVVLSCDVLDQTGSAAINGSFNLCPSISATTVSPVVQSVGRTIALGATARDVDLSPAPLAYAWTSPTGTIASPTTTSPVFTCTTVGPVTISFTVTDGSCSKSGTVTATCVAAGSTDGGVAPDAAQPVDPRSIVINEVESNGGTPGDWAELYNTGAQPIDVGGWLFKDNDDTRTFRIAAGTVVQPGAYLVLEEAQFSYGLGGADATRLYLADGTTLVDSYSWTAHAVSTYGRCPNGVGAFQQTASSKGAANDCGALSDAGVDAGADASVDAGSPGASNWPGSGEVVTVDPANTYASNLSGLVYQAGATPASSLLWAVQNGPAMVYRLQASGASYTSTPSDGWAAGKAITYPSGSGVPDTEGVTLAPGAAPGQTFLYVSTERDNNMSTVSRLSVLMLDPSTSGTNLTALREWNLTGDLPPVGANLGLEGITFIADSELAAQSFREGNGQPYNPNRFPQHGGGIFLVGVEGTGMIHVYALNHADSTFLRLTSFSSGMPGIMDLAYDADTNYLWAYGDDTQNNTAVLFEIEQNMASMSYGQFVQRKVLQRPSGLPNVNNEGITFAPESECVGGVRSFFWADDGNTSGHSLRRGSLACGKGY